ncbi:MAG: YIP1 family protein [Pseudomonadota bacterium]
MEKPVFNLETVISSAKEVLTDPKGFYSRMDKKGGYAEPSIFVGVMAVVTGVLGAVFSLFAAPRLGGMTFGFLSIVIMPIVCVLGAFIAAAIMHAIWKLMGSAESFETSFRCLAYSCAILPLVTFLSFIPYLGTLVSNLWWFFLMYVAATIVHQRDSKTSMIVLGVLAALVTLMNISGERTQRQLDSRLETLNEQMGDLQNMTPEELGEMTGKFLKGLQQGANSNQ